VNARATSKELQEWPENLLRRVAEAEAALNVERVANAETRQKLKELIGAKEDGVSPKDVSHSPVIEVRGERDTSINSSAAASMTEFREVKSAADDLRVEIEVKNQLDKDVSHSTPSSLRSKTSLTKIKLTQTLK
jgi:hypothetical protein